ncbi:hypothetical protein ZHAS_00003308 [Anopheles sinensis]|uniref:Ionotropic glutamate receptor C-terminal domain-containing protein n=1 Tax=Anopheles sinensis TaxID=74873 RepID=A0A084VE15_ANOSI|nr:hypothetical protein ZHAS_00003308 [Anopheles sinensis]
MHQYHLDEVIDSQLFPFHFIIYGRYSFLTREAFFISMFVERLNITMVDRENYYNHADPQKFGSILKQNSIVASYGHTPGDFRRVFTNEMEGICAMTIAGNKTTFIEAFIDPFDRYIWISWLVTSEMMLIVWMLIRWKRRRLSSIKNIVQEYVDLHFHQISFFILSPPNLRNASKLENMLTFCYLVAIFHIVTLYESIVTSNLSTTRYGKVINSIQQLIDLQVPIIGLESTIETLNASRSGFNLNGQETNRFVAQTCSYARLGKQQLENHFHVIREPLLSHYVVYLLHKESILQETLEKYVALSYQADLYRYWDHFIPLKSIGFKTARAKLMANVIEFDELMWQFIILPIGGMLGALVFLVELVWHKFALRRQQLTRN